MAKKRSIGGLENLGRHREEILNSKPPAPKIFADTPAQALDKPDWEGNVTPAKFFKPVLADAMKEADTEEDTNVSTEATDPGFTKAEPEEKTGEEYWETAPGAFDTSHSKFMGRDVLRIPIEEDDRASLNAFSALYRIKPYSEDWYRVYQDIAASHENKDALYWLQQTLQKYPPLSDTTKPEIRKALEKAAAFITQAKARKVTIIRALDEERARNRKK